MPRRRQRFSNLERQFRDAGGVADDGSRLAGYIKFKKGETRIKIDNNLTAAQRKRFAFAILPFNIEVAATEAERIRYAAPITQYSHSARITAPLSAALSNAKLGYEDVDETTMQAGNFFPALLRIFVKDNANGALTTKLSAVTGKGYKTYEGKSYSIPFGRTIAGLANANIVSVSEETVRKNLTSELKEIAQVGSVSYDPEVFRSGSTILASPA
ncbi:MAG: hypothetical protein HC836_40350 [Richelia sp. RM2_1_2]|nr:hypothetical protein [Richelia sp. RM2_1_2]